MINLEIITNNLRRLTFPLEVPLDKLDGKLPAWGFYFTCANKMKMDVFEELWTELFRLSDNPYSSSLNILSEWANRDYNKIEHRHMGACYHPV